MDKFAYKITSIQQKLLRDHVEYNILSKSHINPGMVKVDNKYVIMSRFLYKGKMLRKANSETHLHYLNDKFKTEKSINLNVNNNLEDPRLIEYNNDIYIFWNSYETKSMHYGLLHDNKIIFIKQIIYTRGKRGEKNWSPFVWNNRVFLIYSIVPHKIYELNVHTGELINQYVSEFDFKWIHQPRGGTPAVEFDGNFLSFFHSSTTSIDKKYEFGAYLFESKEPFRIIKQTKIPFQLFGIYPKNLSFNHELVVFPCGIIVEDGKTKISIGINDVCSKILIYDNKYIMDSLNGL